MDKTNESPAIRPQKTSNKVSLCTHRNVYLYAQSKYISQFKNNLSCIHALIFVTSAKAPCQMISIKFPSMEIFDLLMVGVRRKKSTHMAELWSIYGFDFFSSCTAVARGRHKAWQWRCNKSNTGISFFFLSLTSVIWPHGKGRYCCWLVNDCILYTDIYVLSWGKTCFFFFFA